MTNINNYAQLHITFIHIFAKSTAWQTHISYLIYAWRKRSVMLSL